MKRAWSAVVFALGFFALVAQALLFRSFLASFEGNELGIGAFFGSWLLWVAAGAVLGRVVARRDVRPTHVALLALAYLPAFVLQDQLIADARPIAGVAAYELFPLHRMVLVSLLANAPTSLLTGCLFTLACRCSAETAVLPVARVYVLESLGACAGGLFVTLLLAGGLPAEAVFLRAACLLALAAALLVRSARVRRGFRVAAAAPLVILLLLLVTGADLAWAGARDRATWRRLLAEDAYRGSFTTAQGKYLYGEREGQFVVTAWGATTEALPGTEHASEVAAIVLAQHPTARRALVVGPGSLALCLRLAAFPQIERVAWFHPDPDYPPALQSVLPERYRDLGAKLEIPEQDVREALAAGARAHDVIVLNLPDVTTLVLNRYATREFFALLERALAPGGVVALRTSGGANYLGSELVYLGSSAYATLRSTFRHVVLKPGDESWFLAANRELTAAPAVLRDRFAGIEGAAALYPPEGLLSLFPPDRIEHQLGRYRRTAEDIGTDVLSNTDRQPKALLYSLAVALRKAGRRAVAGDVAVLLAAGARIGAAAILLYLLLRVVYVLRSPRAAAAPAPGLFDGGFLIFSTGLAGMALSVVCMFLFQARHGSLFLHAGLVISLFMLGVFLGGLLAASLLGGMRSEPRPLLPCLLGGHVALCALFLLLPPDVSRFAFGGLFVLAGIFTGVYFPIAAHRLKAAGRSPAAAGAGLEMLDHFGGAAGAVLAGLFLLPLLGTTTTLLLLALLVAVNLPPALWPRLRERGAAPDPFSARLRAAGYTAFGVAAWLLLASHLAAAAEAGQRGQRLEAAARELGGTTDLREKSAGAVTYFEVPDPDGKTAGWVFSSETLAPDVYGYHGPITLALHVDREGTLKAFRILRSRETPAYLARLETWLESLAGRNLFAPDPFRGVDVVSGATMSSQAIVGTLARAGRGFATGVLGREVAGAPPPAAPAGPNRDFVCLGLLTAGAILLRYRPHVWLRRLFLAVTLVVTGFWLNLQFSTQHVFGLLSLDPPALRLTGGFFMIFLVPLVVLLFGNVYCGWVCPFGALQELAGDLRRRLGADTDPHPRVWRYGRAVKYGLLALLAALFAWTRDYAVLAADPLITFFDNAGGVFALGIAAVALSLVFRRFWCRNLCPAGAFLALLNGATVLRRFLPRAQVGRCDLGVRSADELDCLRCDRCRHEED